MRERQQLKLKKRRFYGNMIMDKYNKIQNVNEKIHLSDDQ